MKRIHYCYLITHTPPEGGSRYYVGIRTAPKGKTPRTDTKYMGGGPWIRRAVEEHPAEFTKVIVEEFDTIEEAKVLERFLVGQTTANSPYSYNLRTGGQGRAGQMSDETKAKMSAIQKAKAEDPAWLAKLSERARTWWAGLDPKERAARLVALLASHPIEYSEEHCRRLSEIHKRRARKMSLAERRKMTSKAMETCHTPKARAKRSDSLCKHYEDPAECAKISARNLRRYENETSEQRAARVEKAAAKNRRLSKDPAWQEANAKAARRPETRANRSAAARRRFEKETPAHRAVRAEQTAAAQRTPKARANHSASSTRRWTNASDEKRAAHAKAVSDGIRRSKNNAWSRFPTKEARSAECKRRSAVRLRRKREVQMIFAALIVNKYGNAEAA